MAGDPGADLLGTEDDILNDGVSIMRVRGQDGVFGTADDIADFSFDNTAPDEGLSAPFNPWFMFFGQFFDHGLDLVQKGGSGTVFIPLQPDDPLIAGGWHPGRRRSAARTTLHGADARHQPARPRRHPRAPRDDIHEHTNQTTPFVDQNQTYTSHPSHQVFLREYEFNAAGEPVATGRLITNRDLVRRHFGNGDDVELGGMAPGAWSRRRRATCSASSSATLTSSTCR